MFNVKTYDVKCPICGRINRSLYLEETEGWMECDKCGSDIRVQNSNDQKMVPKYILKRLEPICISTVG